MIRNIVFDLGGGFFDILGIHTLQPQDCTAWHAMLEQLLWRI